MLSFTVRMRFDEADHDDIRHALEALTVGSRQEPGCVSYICHFLESDPTTVFIYEQYKDSAALDAHRATLHFKDFAIGVLYQRMKERAVENLTAVA
jgi:quinol monooxygenase YgiN